MTGSDVCALNLQSQLMGKMEGSGMRRVLGLSPAGRDAAGSVASGKQGAGDKFPPWALGGREKVSGSQELPRWWPVTI